MPEDRGWFVAQVDNLGITASADLPGLRKLLANDFDQNARLRDLEQQVASRAAQRRRETDAVKEQPTDETGVATQPKTTQTIELYLPPVIETGEQIEALVMKLKALITQLSASRNLRIRWKDKP